MKKIWIKPAIFVFFAATLFTCVDPYSPKLENFHSLLVVDALLTDENKSNMVRLSRSKSTSGEEPEMVTGAEVLIKDNLGNSTTLFETAEGIYKTDSILFRGKPGNSYTLHVKTSDGKEYESEPCLMIPIQEIDSIYYTKSEELIDTETQEGIRISIDSKGESECKYYRWTYEEWWKIRVPNPKKYDFVDEVTYIECSPIKKICWGHETSHDIIIRSSESGISKPILFVSSSETSRLLIQYFIKIRQFSISKEEYEFWNLMKQVSESGGDIFDKQPFQVSGNIHNINNPNEKILGYFQVSGARESSRYITRKEIEQLELPHYNYPCNTIVVGPKDIPTEGNMPPPSIGTIYAMFTSADLVFIEPLWGGQGVESLVFSSPICADCTRTGSLSKPSFWIDLL